MTKPIPTTAFGKYRKPGFLLEPLGWVSDRLTQAIESEPTLIDHLFNLEPARMHLVAVALAHMRAKDPPVKPPGRKGLGTLVESYGNAAALAYPRQSAT